LGIVDAACLERMLLVYMDLCTRDVVLTGVGEECFSATGQTLVNERLQVPWNKMRLWMAEEVLRRQTSPEGQHQEVPKAPHHVGTRYAADQC
jgi:hypothetical protein